MSISLTPEEQELMNLNMSTFRKVSTRKLRYVIYHIENYVIKTDTLGQRSDNFLTFKNQLPKNQPRYIVYDHEYKTYDGRQTSKMYFIFWTPNNVNQTDKVTYSQALNDFRARFNGVINHDAYTSQDIEDLLKSEYCNNKYTIPQQNSDQEDDDSESFD